MYQKIIYPYTYDVRDHRRFGGARGKWIVDERYSRVPVAVRSCGSGKIPGAGKTREGFCLGSTHSQNRIYVWDEKDMTLRALDKWEPGSKAAAAYGYFKAQGARVPMTRPAQPGDDLLRFDPEVAAYEVSQACDRQS